MNPKRAKTIINQFAGKRILVVGDVMLDRYVFGKVERLNPEAPVPILHVQSEKYATGGAGNTAKNVAALGGQAVLIGVVGEDTVAKRVEKAAQEEGYAARLIPDATRPTIEKIRYLVRSQQMLRVDYEKLGEIDAMIEKKVVAEVQAAAKDVDAIIVSDYAKGVVTQSVAEAIMSEAKKRDLPVMADVKPSRANFFKGATWLSPNRKEAFEFLGLDQFDNGGLSPAQLADRVREAFSATVFLTLGAEGMYVASTSGESARLPLEHVIEVADTSGAGDTAQVAIVLAKLAGATDVEAAQLGNAAGAVVVSKVGAVGVAPEELLAMISHEHA